MTNFTIKRAMLQGGTALQALTLLGAGLSASMIVAAPAAAQDYTSGAIAGTVTDDAGNGVAGATVTINSTDLGFNRTATTSASGSFRFTGLPPGTYSVVVEAAGQPGYRQDAVSILASQTASLDVLLAAAGGDDIVVTGSRVAQDFVGTQTGRNVDLAEFARNAPIQRDLTSVVLLAPGTSLGDDGFAKDGQLLPSVGGSSIAENAYYLNGLNTTNFDNYVGSARVPFEFIRSVDIKTGGYSAEFGRATGGIVNQVSKAGSNDFTAAMHVNYEPDFLRSNSKNITTIDADGLIQRSTDRGFDRTENYSAILEAGGPVIRDKLFLYGLVEFRETKTRRASPLAGLSTERVSNDPFYAFKIDAFPIDGQHLEFTAFDTSNTERRTDFAFSNASGSGILGSSTSVVDNKSGGFNFVGKYTGTFTDWLTVSAAYGRVRDRFDSVPIDEGSSTFFFQNASGATVNGVPQGGLFTGQPVLSRDFPYDTEREFYRADADLFFNILGDHHVRFGFDVENNTLNHVSVRNGGNQLFNELGFLSAEAFNANTGNAGAALVLRANNVLEINYFNGGGGFEAQNKAFYIQDEWKITDRLTLNLGVRRDDFGLDKPGGVEYIKLKENYAPRVGFSYNLWEQENGRLYGSFGHYYLPIASNTAFRQASPELFIRERFNYSGFLPNGLPNVTSQVTNLAAYQAACPFGLTVFSSGQNCNVTGDGTVKPTDASLSQSLEATRQSEYIIGYEHRVGGVTLGINYTHRNLDVSAEDVAVDAAILAYCAENGLTGCEDTWTGFHQYVILNPGDDATFALAGQDGRTVTISAEDLRYPKAKRTYDAVEFTFDRPFDGKWSIGGSYSWSRSKGNSEGFVQSDFEQDDSGITQDFDQPGFTQFAYGYLPNHRRHRFKINGAVAVTEQFTFGTNVRVDSPRKLSCIGFNPNPNYFDPNGDPYSDFGNAYGAASHYCNGQPAPRGEGERTNWVSTIDLSARYNVQFGDSTLTLRGDVFNLLNSQAVAGRSEIGELDIEVPNPNYGRATGYQAARFVRLGIDVNF